MQLLIKLIDARIEMCDSGKHLHRLLHPDCSCWQRSSMCLLWSQNSPSVQVGLGAGIVVCAQCMHQTDEAHIAFLVAVPLLRKLCSVLSRNCRVEIARKFYGVCRRWGVIFIWTLCSGNDLLLTRWWHFPFCSRHEFMGVHSIPFPRNPSLHLQSFCCFNKRQRYIMMIKTVYIF